MAKRSLQASAEGIRKAKQAFKRKGWTQEYLAAEVGLGTRQPIWKFFTGKPIDRYAFNDICSVLELEPSEIIQKPNIDGSTLLDMSAHSIPDVDALVQRLRSAHHEKIQSQCSTLQLLDIAQPIKLNDIYIDVNILEEITSKRWLEITDLQRLNTHQFNPSDLDKLRQKPIGGIEAVKKYAKMVILGKPGSGKTTFLQSIAISCNQGYLRADCLPIFISLRNFAEDIRGNKQLTIFNYLHEYFINLGISELEMAMIFSHGRALILLDGLDEIIGEYSDQIINKIRNFTDKYYKNQIIVTCRTGCNSDNFQGFTQVEIADFSKTQIAAFANKWFLVVAKNPPAEAQISAHKFIQKLERTENLPILELSVTPILLNLTCLFFKFAQDFPPNRSELYKQALDLLLVRWDEARGIKRNQIYPELSLLHKIKLLSRIAAIYFTQGNYFLPEAKILQLITDYLRHLPNASTDTDALQLESAAVLKVIEIQHGLLVERAKGIYSFSNLTLQKYLAAREIVSTNNAQALTNFLKNLNRKSWQEVFLLSAEIFNPPDIFLQLMKQKIDDLAAVTAKISDFLGWVEQKSFAVSSSYHSASVRAFYFTIALPPEHSLARNQDLSILLDHRLAGNLAIDLALDLALVHALAVSLSITTDIFSQRFPALILALDLRHLLADKPSLQTLLQDLKNHLPSQNQGRDTLKIWWQTNGKSWTDKLRNLMINTRHIGHDWHFNSKELHGIQQYWDANKLLINCLNSAEYVAPNTRSLIENNLFLIGSYL